jgi:hypothetical protein
MKNASVERVRLAARILACVSLGAGSSALAGEDEVARKNRRLTRYERIAEVTTAAIVPQPMEMEPARITEDATVLTAMLGVYRSPGGEGALKRDLPLLRRAAEAFGNGVDRRWLTDPTLKTISIDRSPNLMANIGAQGSVLERLTISRAMLDTGFDRLQTEPQLARQLLRASLVLSGADIILNPVMIDRFMFRVRKDNLNLAEVLGIDADQARHINQVFEETAPYTGAKPDSYYVVVIALNEQLANHHAGRPVDPERLLKAVEAIQMHWPIARGTHFLDAREWLFFALQARLLADRYGDQAVRSTLTDWVVKERASEAEEPLGRWLSQVLTLEVEMARDCGVSTMPLTPNSATLKGVPPQ